MKCLLKYKWVKLPRALLPQGKGIMGHWARLASRSAFRKGNATYCGYSNPVNPGMWSGGIVGVKSILGARSRQQALSVLEELQNLGYITYTLEQDTKKLTYQITDWVVKCSGSECTIGTVYATEGYGFLCIPRDITQRLVDRKAVFGESDAWLDLWCHTTFEDYGNAFSFLSPTVQFGKYGSILTLDGLGQRWGWEKTKVWRFFRKFQDTFPLYRLPGSFGCVVFNTSYCADSEVSPPTISDVMRILDEIRTNARDAHICGNDNERLNCMVAWRSRRVMLSLESQHSPIASNSRVAVLAPITRAYFSHGKNCINSRDCNYDCQGKYIGSHLKIPDSITQSFAQMLIHQTIIPISRMEFFKYGKKSFLHGPGKPALC